MEELENQMKAHEGLVKSIAKEYTGRNIEFKDLIQHGNIGLWKAIEKFDETLGYELSTYVTRWIKTEIEEGIADGLSTFY